MWGTVAALSLMILQLGNCGRGTACREGQSVGLLSGFPVFDRCRACRACYAGPPHPPPPAIRPHGCGLFSIETCVHLVSGGYR